METEKSKCKFLCDFLCGDKSSNLVESVPVVYKPHSISKLHVEPLKYPNVEPNVKSSSMVSVVVDNINEKSVFVTPSKIVVVGPL